MRFSSFFKNILLKLSDLYKTAASSLDFWTGLYAAVNEYVDRFTLADLVREELEKQGRASRPSTD